MDGMQILVMLALGMTASTVGLGTALWHTRSRARRAEALLAAALAGGREARPADPTAAALDSLAVEVERIGESQRFLTRVLTERAAGLAPAPDAAPRAQHRTPH